MARRPTAEQVDLLRSIEAGRNPPAEAADVQEVITAGLVTSDAHGFAVLTDRGRAVLHRLDHPTAADRLASTAALTTSAAGALLVGDELLDWPTVATVVGLVAVAVLFVVLTALDVRRR